MVTSLQIGTLTLDPAFYLLNRIDGLEDVAKRLPSFNLPGQDGIFVSNSLSGERRVHIEGNIRAADAATYLTKRSALIAALKYTRDANGLPVATTLKFTLNSDSTQQYQFDCYEGSPAVIPFKTGEVSTGSFLLDLIAPDPALYSQTLSSTTLVIGSGGGAAIPTAIPASLTSGIGGGPQTLNNTGNVDSFPTITLTGPLTTPIVSNLTTGKIFKLNLTMLGTDVITIDMKNKTVLQGSTNQMGSKTDDSSWWSLQPGLNTISVSAQNAHTTESAVVTFRSAYLGV